MRTITLGPPPPPQGMIRLQGPPPPPRIEEQSLVGVSSLIDIPSEPSVLLGPEEEPEFEETVLLADPDPAEKSE